jgi:hypothetical protein
MPKPLYSKIENRYPFQEVGWAPRKVRRSFDE